jgi:predicted CoA-binding protein
LFQQNEESMTEHRKEEPAKRHVVVVGASPNPGRYSNQAVRLLAEKGFQVTPVHPDSPEIGEFQAVAGLEQVTAPVDTLTLYVNHRRSEPMADRIVALSPGRVIFNPGSESEELERRLDRAGIRWLRACTLVLLRSGDF